jgi:hypothetical protein
MAVQIFSSLPSLSYPINAKVPDPPHKDKNKVFRKSFEALIK